jgi:hypothetical protein
MSQPTPALGSRRTNSALWIGALLMVLGILSNMVSFWKVPTVGFTWVAVVLPILSVVVLLVGVVRAFRQPMVFGGKISGTIVTVVAVLLGALWTFGFVHARELPASSGAPKVGQKAPDFTLTNTSGQQVTLSQLLSTPIDTLSGKAPKAVLLIFYRGYW